MIKNKSELGEWLEYERNKYGLSGFIRTFFMLLAGSEVATIWAFQRRLRITEYYKNCNHRIRYMISRTILNYKKNKYGLQISLNVFGKGLRIMHIGPILTNGFSKVGEDCSIHINTAIVAQGVDGKVPVLGNNIVIGVGAVILGGINIANGIAIGANAVVNKSFDEENIAIAGVPAKKISNNGTLNWGRIDEE